MAASLLSLPPLPFPSHDAAFGTLFFFDFFLNRVSLILLEGHERRRERREILNECHGDYTDV